MIDLIDEVNIFHAPGIDRWVIRQNSGMFRIGDRTVKSEPTDEYLKSFYGKNILITRGYDLFSVKAKKFVIEKLTEKFEDEMAIHSS